MGAVDEEGAPLLPEYIIYYSCFPFCVFPPKNYFASAIPLKRYFFIP